MNNLVSFINDPYNDIVNFLLACEYDVENQKSSAISHYLNVAEYSKNKDLIYESLIKLHMCLEYIGKRPNSSKNALLNAISCIPNRPEAWYFLSSFLEKKEERKESYTASIMSDLYKDNSKETISDIGYYQFHPQFQKAVTTWWVGNCDEARILFEDLLKNHQLNDEYTTLVHNNLRGLNGNRFYNIPYNKVNHKKLKHNFKKSKLIKENYSQVYQDMFVLTMLDGKENGCYVEIGSADPIYNNNTYLLEKDFNWSGVSIDIDPNEIVKFQNVRKNLAITQDATKLDYSELFNNLKMSKTIDYLQIDCEPSDITYKVLEQIPFDEYMFGVITYEHDYYSDITKLYRDKSRQFLIDKGYLMVVGDIAPDKNSTFEDWWVHPDIVDKNILEKMLNTHQGVKRADEYFLMP